MPSGDRQIIKYFNCRKKVEDQTVGKPSLIVKITRTLEEIPQRLKNFCI